MRDVAYALVGHDPFALILSDDVIKSDRPCPKQLLEVTAVRLQVEQNQLIAGFE